MKVSVIGSGSWGTALANVLADNGHEVTLWGRNEETIAEIQTRHENNKYLPGAKLASSIQATTDLEHTVLEAEAILLVVPTAAMRQTCQNIRPYLEKRVNKPIIIHATKGIEQGTHLRMSEVIEAELADVMAAPVVVLSGPSHAEEVVDRQITTLSVACRDLSTAEDVQDLFMNAYFRVYTNEDVLGVELGGALKNIIALACGILVGLDFGDNARAALMTRGLAEITRLGTRMGADPLTFSGLSGLGDLIVTCTSEHSRNYQAGYMLAQGKNRRTVSSDVGMVVEGMSTTQAAAELAQELNVEMPITSTLQAFIYEDLPVDKAVDNLMLREGKTEALMKHHPF
ncbi:NAD(P)H-dependent glycerol-3-phosphate dehydrogenase [Suicoccus acidiformans]|uniref:Glycerol-3-phosphate dehydrogenase [NAD(P)+] n=1 Tax=Suicoccus acidiformans TaxID=2036206 RepID=A0A347WNA4_9LACT|nr:NAD(P)H-dependent glycerol-3-phosphate dehydrogenase [Suicoccus acidiformans]AXY26561.1 NAD(P)H-dependent glycerol-3-phosphate dehydrogenase [Suicoccus acidiformans]